MDHIAIKMNEKDFERFKKALGQRLPKWEGKPDIHGHFNSPRGHAVGLWGELGLLKWFEANDLPARWAGEDDDAMVDIEICQKIGVETKAQQPRNWTPELATTVQKRSYENWLKKGNVRYVVWTTCYDPLSKGIQPVLIRGWNTVQEIGDSGLQKIRGTLQYRTYPKYHNPSGLLRWLKSDCM
ncbi:MAG: hypothetical protein U9O54_01430 [Chloroflexota bacterium]|nr:hypothetical protein [Chloroflexota bacterium]